MQKTNPRYGLKTWRVIDCGATVSKPSQIRKQWYHQTRRLRDENEPTRAQNADKYQERKTPPKRRHEKNREEMKNYLTLGGMKI